jgi:hypothetical protein
MLMAMPWVKAVLGDVVVGRGELVDWCHRTQAVMPPTEPNVFDFKHLHLDSFLAAVEKGAAAGEIGHLLRAATALLPHDVNCDRALASRVSARDVAAAREYLGREGPRMWASMLHRALATKQLHRTDAQLLEQAQKVVGRPANTALEASMAIMVESIVAAGFDPMRLPPFPVGRPNPAKNAARPIAAQKGLSGNAFERIWDEVRRRGLVRDDRSRT